LGTARELEILYVLRLQAEYDHLTALKRALDDDPPLTKDIAASVFLSSGTINDILKGADGLVFPLQSAPDVIIHIDEVRTYFLDGFPLLKVVGWAEDPKWNIRVTLRVSAIIEPVVNIEGLDHAKLKVYIIDVVPELKWGPVDLPTGRLVRNLLVARAFEYTEKLPDFTVPIRHLVRFSNPASSRIEDIPIGGATLRTRINQPAMNGEVRISARRVLFLRDGIHVFLII